MIRKILCFAEMKFSLYHTTAVRVGMFDATSAINGLLRKYTKSAAVLSQLNSMEIKTNYHRSSSSYEDAIKALNSLQSNAVTIQNSVKNQQNNITDTLEYLRRIEISPEKLDQLSVIHVSGTKGKGSTCAFTESILRSFGCKTGFFSSPHLISVVERIRINGKPIDKEIFTEYFWKTYKPLNEQKVNENDMPAYFKFLTILALKIFIELKVDVAIIEVGIGGEKDCTNVVRNTKTIGITSLGLEHTNLLGNTLSDIAWQKAGIIKPNSYVFTTQQPEECMNVIQKRAKEKNAKCFVVPKFDEYKWVYKPKLKLNTRVQEINASIAIQLAYNWLKLNKRNKLEKIFHNDNTITYDICEEVIEGLQNCFWPGRCHMIEIRNKRFFFDGAHTKESIEVCCEWLQNTTLKSNNKTFLIFNVMGSRDSIHLLQILEKNIKFTQALFVTNQPFQNVPNSSDISSSMYSMEQQMKRVQYHYEYWTSKFGLNSAYKFKYVLEALNHIENLFTCNNNEQESQSIDVLVTGSLHLVGSTLLALEEHDKQFCNLKSQ